MGVLTTLQLLKISLTRSLYGIFFPLIRFRSVDSFLLTWKVQVRSLFTFMSVGKVDNQCSPTAPNSVVPCLLFAVHFNIYFLFLILFLSSLFSVALLPLFPPPRLAPRPFLFSLQAFYLRSLPSLFSMHSFLLRAVQELSLCAVSHVFPPTPAAPSVSFILHR